MELMKEMEVGTSILNITGYDMIGESETLDLTDIDLQKINKYVNHTWESKNLCFLREKIIDMNYGPGCHSCSPTGKVVYSSNVYINKHMNMLGLDFLINKNIKRYERTAKNISEGLSVHYTNDIEKIKQQYKTSINNCNIIV